MAQGSDNVFVQRYLTPIAVLLAAVIIAFALIFGSGMRASGGPEEQAVAEVDIKDVNTNDSPFIGDKNAPNAIAVYYDYQCSFCKQFELGVTPSLMEEVNAGKLKIVFKDFQFLGEDSKTAALLSRAIFELHPDQFGKWYAAVMTAQDSSGDQGFGDLASLQQLLRTQFPQINVDRVTARMNEKKADYEKAILADYEEGVAFGVTGTPSVIVGKQLLTGMSPEQFQAAIKAELGAQGS